MENLFKKFYELLEASRKETLSGTGNENFIELVNFSTKYFEKYNNLNNDSKTTLN